MKGDKKITMTCFAEFASRPAKERDALAKSEVKETSVKRGRKTLVVRSRYFGKIAFSSISKVVACATCGDTYNGSTAPIEPYRFCSESCEASA